MAVIGKNYQTGYFRNSNFGKSCVLSERNNDAFNSVSGYDNTDVNGDDFVDASDISIVDNNVFNSVLVRNPIGEAAINDQ